MDQFKEIVTRFRKVYIQTHNFPDADAIASAWGTKKLVESFGVEAEIIYYGSHIFKPNIDNMINKYQLKMSLIGDGFVLNDDEFLLIVDGQYGSGNVIPVDAKNIGTIDHHLEEKPQAYLYKDIQPRIGACSTLVFSYLKEYQVEIDPTLSTILYFGLLMDTDLFAGKMTTLDNEAKQELETLFDKKVIDFLRLSSISFEHLQIFANGILKSERYNNIIFSCIDECDDNLLGHISDLLSEIDGIEIVVVYSSRSSGIKLSVRSYHEYLTAEELVKDLTEGVGSGGGHQNKAGGYIDKERFDQLCGKVSIGIFIRTRIIDYCRSLRFLETGKDNPFAIYGTDKRFKAKKKKVYLRFLKIKDYFNEDVVLKTLEGVVTASVDDVVIIGQRSEIWPVSPELFIRKYQWVEEANFPCLSDEYIDEYGITIQSESKTLRITKDNIRTHHICLTSDDAVVDGIELTERVKIRSKWGDFLAKKGDYLLYNNLDDYYICDREIFDQTYDVIG